MSKKNRWIVMLKADHRTLFQEEGVGLVQERAYATRYSKSVAATIANNLTQNAAAFGLELYAVSVQESR
jgi:hypothetical protein